MSASPIVLKGFSISLGERELAKSIDFAPPAGTSNVIIGPTGVGKSVLLKAIGGVLAASPFKLSGSVTIHGYEAYVNGKKSNNESWRRIRTQGLVFVPAESTQAMNPALTLEHNLKLLAPASRALIEKRLKDYFSIDFQAFARLYPDEVSGGELQRITLMILLSRPGELVMLDEPTVNLDRNLRKRFVEFLNNEILSDKTKTIVMASHDLDFLHALHLDQAYGLHGGKLEKLDAVPVSEGFEKQAAIKAASEGLSVEGLSQTYFKRGIFGEHTFEAFADLSLRFDRSTIYGITGPSGCGKSSLIKAILRLMDGTTGKINFQGHDLVAIKPRERGSDPVDFTPFRRKMAVVQQESRYSFFPDLKVRDSIRHIEMALGESESEANGRLAEALAKVGLTNAHLNAYPRSLSSGEMKRMDIARALAAKPEILLLDEPFAHIDFETRAKVMQAIADYMANNSTILIVVTHEDFDLKYFVETNYDFPELLSAQKEKKAKGQK
jgi:ABC-type multidrug transport system ATPase subunit